MKMAAPNSHKKKHTFLNIETKLEILTKLSKGESGSSLAKLYGVGRSTISDIKMKKDSLAQYALKLDSLGPLGKGSRKRKTLRKANNSALEDAIYLWYTEKRSLGESISGPLICKKALEFNEKLCGSPDFKASTGWLKNFKLRHGIRELDIQRESLHADANSSQESDQIDSGYQNLNDEDIDNMIVVKDEPLDDYERDESQDIADEESAGPSHVDAFNALEIAVSWLEKQPECSTNQLLLLREIRDMAANKCASRIVEVKIEELLRS